MSEEFTRNIIENFDEKLLNAFISDLEQYDKDHNAGAWLGRGLAGMIMKDTNKEVEEIEDETKTNEGLESLQQKIQESLTINDLENRHNPVLSKLGLSLESPNKKGDLDENETYAVGSIKINLEDKTKYLSFLKLLNKEKLTGTQKKILEMVAEKLIDQVQNEYKLEEADDRLLELFSGMKKIISEYERLGMGKKVNDFKHYLEYANSGYLREYIFAKNKGMFRPIGEGFALSTYQQDASYEHYLEYWNNNFFETIDLIKKNKNAKSLYNQVLKYAKDCISFAENDPKLTEYETNGQKEYVNSVRKAIKEIKDKLSKISEI